MPPLGGSSNQLFGVSRRGHMISLHGWGSNPMCGPVGRILCIASMSTFIPFGALTGVGGALVSDSGDWFVLHRMPSSQANDIMISSVAMICVESEWGFTRYSTIWPPCCHSCTYQCSVGGCHHSLTRLALEGFLLHFLKVSGGERPLEVPPTSASRFPRPQEPGSPSLRCWS